MDVRTKRMNRLKLISKILFILYMCAVFYVMFLADSFNRTTVTTNYRYNLKLFVEIERFRAVWNVHGPYIALINLLGNVACFVPFGFFVPFHSKGYRNIIVVTCLTFIFSLFIELTQLILKIGVFDVDDLLLNTIGGIIGYIGYAIAIRLYIYSRKPKKQVRK